MTTVLCTLYNSLYLDKGLVLYDSLCECAKDFKLYVLCMDDKCYEVLTDLNQEHHIPVRLSDFEKGDEALLAAKANRPMGEYCWTCSSSFIRYVLKHYNECSCTYIDADMYFYTDPKVLIDEMMAAGKSVMVVPHWFSEESMEQAKRVGTYCVEFNTFLNRTDSLEVLDYWRERCLECCSNLGDGVHWGDQLYLEELVRIFACVHICNNKGAGIAPWNVSLYKRGRGSGKWLLRDPQTEFSFPIVFFHYQGIRYLSKNKVDTSVIIDELHDDYVLLIKELYSDYLNRIDYYKSLLEDRYGISLLIKHHPSEKIPYKKRLLMMLGLLGVYKKIRQRKEFRESTINKLIINIKNSV